MVTSYSLLIGWLVFANFSPVDMLVTWAMLEWIGHGFITKLVYLSIKINRHLQGSSVEPIRSIEILTACNNNCSQYFPFSLQLLLGHLSMQSDISKVIADERISVSMFGTKLLTIFPMYRTICKWFNQHIPWVCTIIYVVYGKCFFEGFEMHFPFSKFW